MGNKNMKLLQTVLGVLGGNAILAFFGCGFYCPHGDLLWAGLLVSAFC